MTDAVNFEQLPEIDLKDSARWKEYVQANSVSKYGRETVEYAERWAKLMQYEMAQGRSIDEVAVSTSYTADTHDLSGAMYGRAVQQLIETWRHGEDLRKWHNASFGRPDSQGLVSTFLIKPLAPKKGWLRKLLNSR